MGTFSASESIKAGWQIFKKRPWFIIGVNAVIFLLYLAFSYIVDSFFPTEDLRSGILANVLSFLLNSIINLGALSFVLKVYDDAASAGFKDLWRPELFLPYLAVSALFAVGSLIGLILLIIPGVIFSLMYWFAPYFVVDKNTHVMDSFKESARITYGHRWELLTLFALALIVNIAGMLALLVGLFVTMPVTALALVHAYRTLSAKAGAPASASVQPAA